MQSNKQENSLSCTNNLVDCVIFAAMPEELEFIESALSAYNFDNISINHFSFTVYHYKNCRVLIAPTGIGTISAAAVISLIYTACRPKYALMTGTAGGINPKLKLRDVIVAEDAFEAEIQGLFPTIQGSPFENCLINPLKMEMLPNTFHANEELLSLVKLLNLPDLSIYYGTVVTSNTFPAPQQLFDAIKAQNPYSIDMETAAFYQVSWIFNIPALAIRGISNMLNEDGTDDAIETSDVEGSSAKAAQLILQLTEKLIDLKSINRSSTPAHQMHPEAAELIALFNLSPHPEGGYYARTFKSDQLIKSIDTNRYQNYERSAGSAIYYLLDGCHYSAWHRIRSDEIWHYYKGSPVHIHTIDLNGNFTTHLLGDPAIHKEASFQAIIPADSWFAAENIDKSFYSFVGCTVSPGFEFCDFELAKQENLIRLYPQHEDIIREFSHSKS